MHSMIKFITVSTEEGADAYRGGGADAYRGGGGGGGGADAYRGGGLEAK